MLRTALRERPPLAGADRPEREVGLSLLERTLRGGEAVVCGQGYAGRGFALAVEGSRRSSSAPTAPRRADTACASFIRQRIESVFWTCKEGAPPRAHGARTLANLRVRVATRLLCLAARISLNYQLG